MKRLFEENTICRLCLRFDDKAYKLNNSNHKAFIESIIRVKKNLYQSPAEKSVYVHRGIPFNNIFVEDYRVTLRNSIYLQILPDDLYVCYVCNTFLAKCFNFARTVWKAQEIIDVILKTTDIITKSLLDGIDRHNNGLNPITLSSVVINGNNFTNDSNYDGHTSAEEVDIEEVNLNDLVEKPENQTKQNQERKKKPNINEPKNYLHANSSSDENEETVACNLDEEEVEIGNINIETSNIFADNLIEDACDEPKPKKVAAQDIAEKIRKTFSLSKIKVKKESPTANEKERKKKSVEIDEDYLSDSTNSSTANEGKRKKKRDDDYHPDSTSHSEDSEYDSYDDVGKRIRKPKDRRVYPMQCDHCDFMVPEKRVHYHHYLNFHTDVEYPYALERDATCPVCGKRISRKHIRRHEDLHNLTQNFKCTLCSKVFPNKIRWYRHVRDIHPKKTYICDYCSKEFKTKPGFRLHIRTHTGSKPYKCHICGEGFAHSGNRTVHIRIKHQNYKYKPKDDEKTPKKRKKNTRYDKEVYDTSDDEPLIRAADPLHKSKTPSGDSNVSPNEKSTKQGPIQMVSENQKQSHKRKKKPK